ncbi:MAG TPA: hypothetical protein VGM98_19575 [Schlesneria sp.]
MAQRHEESLEVVRGLYSLGNVRRRHVWSQRVILLSVWLCLFGMMVALVVVDWLRPFRPQDPRTVAVVAAILVFFIGGLLAGLINLDRIFGLACHACGKQLDLNETNVAIAIHACPRCRGALFHEWPITWIAAVPATDDSTKLWTLADIRQAEKTQTRCFQFALLKTALAAAAVFAITRLCLLAVPMPSDVPAGIFEQSLATVTGGIVVLVGMNWSMRHAESQYSVKCLACAHNIHFSRIMRSTGNCLNCGCRVLRDADLVEIPAEKGATHLLSRSAYRAAADRFIRQGVWMCLGIFGGGAGIYYWLVICWFGYRLNREISFREVALVYVGLLVLIAVLGGLEIRLKRRLRCPNCGNSLLQNQSLILATGNCAGCGRGILEPTHVDAKE